MKIALMSDDFSPKNSNFGILEEMREHFPNFKITMFTVPWEIRWGEQTPVTLEKFRPFAKGIQMSQSWLEVAIHGLTHAPMEFAEISYDNARKRLIVAEKMFANAGITFARIFKAPFWTVSYPAKRALKDLGYKVLEDGCYQWNLADDKPIKKADVIITQSHVQQTCGNGLEEVYPKLMKLPVDTEWLFLSEVLEAEKVAPEALLKEPEGNGIVKENI
jgi:hypothetical protein